MNTTPYYYSSKEILNFASLTLYQLSETLKKFSTEMGEDQTYLPTPIQGPPTFAPNQAQNSTSMATTPNIGTQNKSGTKRKQSGCYSTGMPIHPA